MKLKKTYFLEHQGTVYGYFRCLTDAKHAVRTTYPFADIVMMVGSEFGEGFHQYVLSHLANGKFQYSWRR